MSYSNGGTAFDETEQRLINAPPTASESGAGGIDAPVHSTSDLQFQKNLYGSADNQSAFTGLPGFGSLFFDESPSNRGSARRIITSYSAPPPPSESGTGGIDAPIHSTSDLQFQKKVYAIGDNQSAFTGLPGFASRLIDERPSNTSNTRRIFGLPSDGGSGLPRNPDAVDGTLNGLVGIRGSADLTLQSSETSLSLVGYGGSSDFSVSGSLIGRQSGAVTMRGAGAISASGRAKLPDIATLSASLGGSGGLSGGRGGSSVEATLRLETDDLLDRFIENNPNLGLLINRGEITAQVARTILTSVKSFIREVRAERQQQFVATASGDGLDQFGELVGARRQAGEGDATMRTRVRAGFGRATSETTIEDLAQVTRTITGASASEIQIEPPVDDVLVVIVRVNSGVLSDSPFGIKELGDFLSDVVPASHAVEVRASGTFILDGPNFTPPPNSGLGEGTLGGTSG